MSQINKIRSGEITPDSLKLPPLEKVNCEEFLEESSEDFSDFPIELTNLNDLEKEIKTKFEKSSGINPNKISELQENIPEMIPEIVGKQELTNLNKGYLYSELFKHMGITIYPYQVETLLEMFPKIEEFQKYALIFQILKQNIPIEEEKAEELDIATLSRRKKRFFLNQSRKRRRR